jgi:rare lipoprotein A
MQREPFFGGRSARPGFAIWTALALSLSAIGSEPNQTASARIATAKETPTAQTGVASYYADQYHGKPTASGEVFDMRALTAAHRSYKFGARVKVTHLGNNRSVIVRINDRGPFVQGRVIDLSLAAAEELQMVKSGLARVKLEIVE